MAQLGAACRAAMLALPLLPVLRLELAKFRGRCSAFTAALLVMCLFKAFVVGGMKTNVVNNLPPSPLLPTLQPIHGGVSVPLNPAFGFQLLSLTPAPQVSQKEIAVRKVNGAQIIDVLRLFIRDILRLALPAVVVGAVGGWYVSRLWLEQFCEKAVLSPILFVLCALAVVAVILSVVCIGCYRVAVGNPVDYLKSE